MNKGNVLFVDDDKLITNLIKNEFWDVDYNVYFANSAKEAFEILQSVEVDVIVSDMIMPDMNGLELLSIVRYKYPHIVRIILSGYSQVNVILSAINEGEIYRYITKPWKVNEKAKKTIGDALEYANFLKNYRKQNPNSVEIYYDKFLHMLKNISTSYIIYDLEYNIKYKHNIEIESINETMIENFISEDYKIYEISNDFTILLK
ncbi:MAG: response regulator [Peptostreptococcaceae bacterium]|nr:response regulator [Peptostreptococcaceae bacterium]